LRALPLSFLLVGFVSSGSYSYPCLRPQSQQQFDQCDQVEEELGRAQFKASSKRFSAPEQGGAFSKPPVFGGLETGRSFIFEQKITKATKIPEFQNIHSNSSFPLPPFVYDRRDSRAKKIRRST
jgi:hypothetical protein